MKTFYFTNPTADRHRAREIQLQIEKETGLKLDNPFYNAAGQPTKEIQALDKGLDPDVSSAEIVENDKKMIRDSVGLIAYVNEKASFGCGMEVFLANEMLGKVVYTICPNERLRKHPWLRQYSTKIFNGVESFVQFAKEKLKDYEQKGDHKDEKKNI